LFGFPNGTRTTALILARALSHISRDNHGLCSENRTKRPGEYILCGASTGALDCNMDVLSGFHLQ
jgi:hypothetical protein